MEHKHEEAKGEHKHDYEALGFKCGLEIHQQLEGKKLFCKCPTEIRRENPDFEVVRRLRASAGEEGAIDKAALHEQKKQKYFIYQGYNDITCAVELDEEPPHPINQEALRAALQVAKMLNCKIVDQIHVMRKTVIDGSNTSGFQRTMLIGVDGYIEVNDRRIKVDTICLEEEASQVIERKSDHDVYNLSRLGIPLIEIATAADIKTPEEAKDAAAKIGMILRSTGACKRGIGTIRQDVNLSIKGGSRVEIKGFQELKSIPKIIDYEIDRHLKLIHKGEKLVEEVRKAEPDMTTSFLRPMPGQDRMYPETDIPTIIPDHKDIQGVQTIEEKIKQIASEFGLSQQHATEIVKQKLPFEELKAQFPRLTNDFLASAMIDIPKEIKTRFKKEIDILGHREVLEKASNGEIPATKNTLIEILVEIADGKKPEYAKYKGISEEELEKEAKKLIAENPNATVQALMGMLMAKHRGKIDGKMAMDVLKKHKI